MIYANWILVWTVFGALMGNSGFNEPVIGAGFGLVVSLVSILYYLFVTLSTNDKTSKTLWSPFGDPDDRG